MERISSEGGIAVLTSGQEDISCTKRVAARIWGSVIFASGDGL